MQELTPATELGRGTVWATLRCGANLRILAKSLRGEHDGDESHHAHANHEECDGCCARIGGDQGGCSQRNGAPGDCPELTRASHASVAHVGWKQFGKECRLTACHSGVDTTAKECEIGRA